MEPNKCLSHPWDKLKTKGAPSLVVTRFSAEANFFEKCAKRIVPKRF